MTKLGERLHETTKAIARGFFTVHGIGSTVIIDDFAATLPEDNTHYYTAPSGRADKRGNLHRATQARRTELVSALKRSGPEHKPPFTLRHIAKGTYEVIAPERAIAINKDMTKLSSRAKYMQKEGERLLRSIDFTTLPAGVDIEDFRRVLQPMNLVRRQLALMETYGLEVLETSKAQFKRLALGSDIYALGDPQNSVHAKYRKPVLPVSGPDARD